MRFCYFELQEVGFGIAFFIEKTMGKFQNPNNQ
jgi:hypothetical protein